MKLARADPDYFLQRFNMDEPGVGGLGGALDDLVLRQEDLEDVEDLDEPQRLAARLLGFWLIQIQQRGRWLESLMIGEAACLLVIDAARGLPVLVSAFGLDRE